MTTLESLIEEGKSIRAGIKFITTPKGVIRLFSAYSLSDTMTYGTWRAKVIRYLEMNFSGERCLHDFENAISEFEKHHYAPSLFDVALGIIVSCQEIDNIKEPKTETDIDKIYRLEADYEKISSSPNDANTQEAIIAFHNWYDAILRYLGQFFDDKNESFKRISTIQTGGNGYTLRDNFDEIKHSVHLLLDKASRENSNVSAIKKESKSTIQTTKKVFIVHGHDDEMKLNVARLLEKFDLEPIILSEQPDKGRTIIEKFEEESNVVFAVVLMSDKDDMGAAVDSSDYKPRARQNVILELGYFIGRLGRKDHVCVLRKGEVEVPSDILGIVYKPYSSNNDGWKLELAKELRSAGYSIDFNRIQ